ncbi:MAG TPA: hypothetical protein VFJ58_03245 [Armatimonadota bacterium]|nr:hypothetical protein [Armatimonadota bacterium]
MSDSLVISTERSGTPTEVDPIPDRTPDERGRIAMRSNTLEWRRMRADCEDDYPGISRELKDQFQQARCLLEQLRQLLDATLVSR